MSVGRERGGERPSSDELNGWWLKSEETKGKNQGGFLLYKYFMPSKATGMVGTSTRARIRK